MFLNRFYRILRNEIINSDKLYGTSKCIPLKRYYRNFLKDDQYFNYAFRYKISKITPLLNFIKRGITILDAGCGNGTEAIICGLLGGNISGIDFSKEHIDIAKMRLKFYEKKYNRKINVKFKFNNILNHNGEYNIIWANESISHIYSLEKFIKLSSENLKSKGKLILSDENIVNPPVYLYARKKHKTAGYYMKIINPISNEKFIMANEMFYSIKSLKKLLMKNFEITNIYNIGYIPFFFHKRFSNICNILEDNFLVKFPIIKKLSNSYVIIGTKRN